MFWKKKDDKPNAKEITPRDILAKKIVEEVEALTKGQTIIYQISEFYKFARFLGVELNPEYPQKGRKYLIFFDQMADGRPAGKRTSMGSANKASEYAGGVVERDSDTYGHVMRIQ